MMLLAYAGVAGTMPSHGHGKSLKLIAILSLCMKSISLPQRNMLFVDRPIK